MRDLNNTEEKTKFQELYRIFRKYREYIFFSLLTITILLTSLYDYLLFHSLIELIGFMITYAIFLVFWNSRKAVDNDFFTFLGLSFFFIGALDLFHALSYSGMNIFIGYDANLPTQLWIAGRFLQSFSLLFAIFCTKGRLKSPVVMIGMAAVTATLFALIFTGNFPTCYIEGTGFTLFKIVSEFVICAAYIASLIFLYMRREKFKRNIFLFLAAAVMFSIIAEIMFFLYFDITDPYYLLGHLFRFVSIYFFYRATVHVALLDPLDLYFQNLQDTQKNRLHSLVENLPEGVVLLDNDNNIVLQNIRAKEFLPILTNYKDSMKRVTQINNQETEHFLEQTSKGSKYHEVTVQADYKRTFQISGVSIKSNNGSNDKILILRDVTTELDLQEKVESSIRLAALGELAQGITHDFNNVMSTILGATEIAESLIEDDDTRKFMELIAKQARKGSEIINQILDFTRQKEVKLELVNLKLLTEETVELVRTGIPSTIVIETKLQGIQILISKIQYQQIIMNILMNSKDSLKKGGKIKLQISSVDHTQISDFENLIIETGDYAKISVQDDGIGMNEKTLSRVFEPFFTTKPRGEGTGLGLSQVYGITRQNDGYISISSKPNKGTTINLYFSKH